MRNIIEGPQRPDTPERQEGERPSLSFGLYYPRVTLTNPEIESWKVTTPSGRALTSANIARLVGVEERRVAQSWETPEYMAMAAARSALGLNRSADIVLLATSFPTGNDLAGTVNDRLRLEASHTRNFHAACSGSDVALEYLASLGEQAYGKKILLGGAEKYSPFLVDLKKEGAYEIDPSLAQTIFSDGAALTAFTYGKDLTVVSSLHHQFDPETSQCLRMPVDYAKMVEPFIAVPIPLSPSGFFEQEGSKVLAAVKESVPTLIRKAVEQANLTPSDIACVITHQGSKPVVETLAGQLPEYNLIRDYQEGNWSSGSVIKGLKRAIDEGHVQKGDTVVLAGFGAGLYASIVVVQLGERRKKIENIDPQESVQIYPQTPEKAAA